ncbi:serine/threonine-protein kinase [Actinomycetospora sp. NBC_00405]|uniref:serine/threonine-protein kinase n=1 Tax=Actinomycetospora sp. NBC_00405 TaxID=2975952 RepID=UPI002E1E4671
MPNGVSLGRGTGGEMEGQRFGRYRLERQIGSGGMGDVYEAADVDRDRLVALKLLPELFSNDNEFEQRFRRESRLAARLRDPHIIPIHDYGEIDGRLFIDMRLVEDGVTIASLLRDGPLAPERAVRLLIQIAEGLDAAHSDGLIHRDVKPSNVLVTPRDFVYIIDFGIARATGDTRAGLTTAGSTVGTLDYMAPERFANSHVDSRADIYSLACLLYQCLTARPPFRGTDLPTLMNSHICAEPPRPSGLVPDIPGNLDTVVLRGMAKKPEDRYQTAGALADAAWRAVEEAGQIERRPTRPARAEATGPDATLPAPTARVGRVGTGFEAAATEVPREAQTHVHPVPAVVAAAFASGTRPDRSGTDATELVHYGQGAAEPEVTAPKGTGPGEGAPRSAARTPPSDATELLDDGQGAPESDGTAANSAGSGEGPPVPLSDARPRSRRPLAVVGAVLVLVLAVTVFAVVAAIRETDRPAGSSEQVASRAVPEVTGSIATPPTPGYMAITPDGRFGYVTNRDPRVLTVLDLGTRATVAAIPMPAPPRFVAFDRAGARAYVSCYDEAGTVNQVVAVDVQARTVAAAVPVDEQPYALAVAPDQRTLWVPSHAAGSIDLVDTDTDAVTRTVPVAPNPHWVVFAAARAYVVNHESNLVTVLNATDARLLATIPVGRSPHSMAPSPDGSRVAVVNYQGNTVSMIDTKTNQVTATVSVGRGPQHVAFAPDGRSIYTANVDDGSVSVIEAATDQVTATVPVGGSPTSIAAAPDGRLAYVTLLDESRISILSIGG